MKYVLIGPTYPYRGGISHYTTLLYQRLSAAHEVKLYSFKRQYPAFLFPGRTDKDPSRSPLPAGHVDPPMVGAVLGLDVRQRRFFGAEVYARQSSVHLP